MRPIATSILLILWSFLFGSASAVEFKPTIYADGRSCPGGCDSHVVFNSKHNGSRFASAPSSSRKAPAACTNGQPCRICFDETDASCLVVTYRGSGPPAGRFDFTPAFFEAFCPKPDLPTALKAMCRGFDRSIEKLTKGRIYCVANPDDAKCKAVIAEAEARKVADQPLYDACKAMSQAAFNKKYQAEPKKQRDQDCAYERHGTGGPNSRGVTWQRLLPAACGPGTYVGRDGTDCCDRNMMAVGGLGSECTPFLVAK